MPDLALNSAVVEVVETPSIRSEAALQEVAKSVVEPVAADENVGMSSAESVQAPAPTTEGPQAPSGYSGGAIRVVVVQNEQYQSFAHSMLWEALVTAANMPTEGLSFSTVEIVRAQMPNNAAVFRELDGGITDGHAGLLWLGLGGMESAEAASVEDEDVRPAEGARDDDEDASPAQAATDADVPF